MRGEGVDGVEPGGLAGGVVAAAEADRTAEGQGDGDPSPRQGEGGLEVAGDHVAHTHAEQDAEDAAEHADDDHFDEELRPDGLGRSAEGLAQADFAGTLGDGDQHDVGEADGGAEQGDETEEQSRKGDAAQAFVELGDQCVGTG